jgi:hypothetical protein
LSLFAAGVAILALLFASYSRRSTWLALGSTAMSMAALLGCLFLSTAQDPGQVRTRLAWIGSQLSLVADRQTLDDLKTAIERVSTSLSCNVGQRPGCKTTASPETLPAGRDAMQAASTTSWLTPKQDPEPPKQESKASQSPVAWRLDELRVPASSHGGGFLISGTNVSDQALEAVHAVLKPDSSKREVELALDVEGHKAGAAAAVPAGARFSLVSEAPNEAGSKQLGGAILTFRYVEAGQRKTSILYLTPSMVARLANRG